MNKLLKIIKSFIRKFKKVKTGAVLKKDGEIYTIDEEKTKSRKKEQSQ